MLWARQPSRGHTIQYERYHVIYRMHYMFLQGWLCLNQKAWHREKLVAFGDDIAVIPLPNTISLPGRDPFGLFAVIVASPL